MYDRIRTAAAVLLIAACLTICLVSADGMRNSYEAVYRSAGIHEPPLQGMVQAQKLIEPGGRRQVEQPFPDGREAYGQHQYTAMTESAAIKTVLFADRFPFRYLTDDYGLTYFAAFSGCSAESEASFETIAFLANKVSELNLPAVLTIESGNRKIADTVLSTANAADRKVLTLNSMQSVTAEDVEKGITYLSMMEENLNALKEALN